MSEILSGKKILILYTAHTMGHQRVAENIAWWLARGGAQVTLREVLKSDPSPLVEKFLKVHVWVNERAPWLWALLYAWGFWIVMMPFRLVVASFQKGEIVKIIKATSPDLVVTTQTAPSAVMSVLKRQKVFTGLWGIAFSDYHFHRAWIYPRADFYLPNIEEQMPSLRRLGVPDNRMFRIGLALPSHEQADPQRVRALFGIPPTAKVILVGSGTLGVRLPAELYHLLNEIRVGAELRGVDTQVIVACGKSEVLYNAVVAEASTRPWLHPLKFYEPMADVYAAIDLMLSKPGGLTIAETLQVSLPVFVTHYLPGQEKLNIEYLTSRGAIVLLYGSPLSEWVTAIIDELISSARHKYLVAHPEIRALVEPKTLDDLDSFIAQLFHIK